jgi:enterochelin esterase family protein
MTLRILRPSSEVLVGNPLGDPHERELWVYLPPGYETSGLRYPVLWCLTGFSGTGEMAVTGNRWSPGLANRMDALIAGGCPPAIVAFPDCFTRWGGSQYMDSSATGRYEAYLCDELVPMIDAEFRTLADRDARGVFGKSSGGYGAVRLAMRRPELFSGLACHSGDMGFAFCYLPDFAKCAASLAAAGSIEEFLRKFESTEKKRGSDFAALNILGMASCYSPDEAAPSGFRLPYNENTGEPDPEIWARWKTNDPVEMVRDPAFADALKSQRLVYLECGSNDEYQLHLGMRQFVSVLEELCIAHEVAEFPDNHRGLNYRYDESLPKLARALRRAE